MSNRKDIDTFIINGKVLVNPEDRTLSIPSAKAQHSTVLTVEPRIMQVLQLLSQNRGNTVERDIFINRIWDDFSGSDESLTQAVSQLRKILRDFDIQDVIITVPKKGYKLEAEIESAVTMTNTHRTESSPTQNLNTLWYTDKRAITLFIVLAFLMMAAFGYLLFSERDAEAPPAPSPMEQQDNF